MKPIILATLAALALPALAHADVKVTPLGSHEGEFCARDRALIFEDPNGTRILYDAGRTVAGADDPRLGEIDVVLVSHMHGDHVGDRHIEAVDGEGSACAKPHTPINAFPNSNSVEIAAVKGAKMVTGSEMARFFGVKLAAAGGDAKNTMLARFGATVEVGGVKIATVHAIHSNAVSPDMVGGTLGETLKAAGLGAYVGGATGYVLEFSNGLVTYLSGDTGMTAEQEQIVRGYYEAKLAVINIGDTFTTGPMEAAWVMDALVQPNAVIVSHANEAATRNGKVLDGTRTKTFLDNVYKPTYVPLSGRTMSFDAAANCTAGCQ